MISECITQFPFARKSLPLFLSSLLTYLESLLCLVVRFPSTLIPGWLYTDPPPFPQRFPISNTCPPTMTLRYRLHTVRYNYNIESFNHLWQTNHQRNLDMDLRNANEFILPPVCRELFRKFPIYSLPWEWNQLGDSKLQRNRTTYKIQLTYVLFQSIPETT
jgi:hypothetical protein